ncbi:hypothetical protein KUTeg_003414 [Tegillarca granosa]|uniref:Secreted protein n=1 Tax=Tegillarca granosa TaxID=220873 RepID=A0ABQ9FM25_TEGGR|nr:hypothetical protein KUTeg_003414 [Tegillarca granosa]
MEHLVWFYYMYISVLAVFIDIAGGACNLPESWQNRSWYLYRGPDDTKTRSASKRLMNCTDTEVYGLRVETLSVIQDKWECFLYEGNTIAFK